MKCRNMALSALGILVFALAGLAQTTAIEGDVKAADGSPVKGALIKIDRKDIKAHYQVKSDKRGHYYYGGLPFGLYRVAVEIDGKEVDFVDNVHTAYDAPVPVNFDQKAMAGKQQEMQKAADTGQLSSDLTRGLTAEQKAQLEKAAKERAAQLSKNKELNAAFNAGMEAQNAKNYDQAVQSFTKASEIDPKQSVIWAHMADSYVALAATKTGADQDALMAKAMDAYQKGLELKPDDAAMHNNYGLAMARAKKFPEAQAELAKAAEIDPANAGKYYYNLGALLVNAGQTDPAGQAFKKAIEAEPNYADAQYQYGVYLVAKAKIGADGKVTPVPGTIEAFQKYLQLKPDGPFAASAKSMLQTLGGSLDTSYQNPNAKKKPVKK